MASDCHSPPHPHHDLLGRTFLARLGTRPVPMIVERVILGRAYCKSLDLRWEARWSVDAVRRALQATS